MKIQVKRTHEGISFGLFLFNLLLFFAIVGVLSTPYWIYRVILLFKN